METDPLPAVQNEKKLPLFVPVWFEVMVTVLPPPHEAVGVGVGKVPCVGVGVGVVPGVGVEPLEPPQTFPLTLKLVGTGLLLVHDPLKPGSELTAWPAGTEPLYETLDILTF